MQRGGFIVPKVNNDLKPKCLNGLGGNMHIFGVNVLRNTVDFATYVAEMRQVENGLVNNIDQSTNHNIYA